MTLLGVLILMRLHQNRMVMGMAADLSKYFNSP
jgi:phage shock protein PspC (stress-responsive transcriptional regulator)